MEDLGSPIAIIYVVAILFAAGVFLFVGYITFVSLNEALLDSDIFNEHEQAKEVVEHVKSYGNLMDYAYLFFIFAFLLAMPIAAYFSPSHPAIFIGFIFLFIIALTLSVVFSDAFELMGEEETVKEYYYNLPILRTFMYYLPIIIIINGALTGIILFGKARAGAGEY